MTTPALNLSKKRLVDETYDDYKKRLQLVNNYYRNRVKFTLFRKFIGRSRKERRRPVTENADKEKE